MKTWPFLPNWRDQLQVTFAYNTEVITSRRGYEQRRALNQNPRKTFQFSTTVGHSRFRRALQFLLEQIGQQAVFADPTTYVRVKADAAAGSTALMISGAAGWLNLGAPVALMDRDRSESYAVDHLTQAGSTYTLNLTTPLLTKWSAGSRVFRGLLCRVAAEVDTSQAVRGVLDGQVSVAIDPATEGFTLPQPAAQTWNGREVFLRRANWRDGATLNFARLVETIDYQRGRVSTYLPTTFTPEVRSAVHTMKSVADIAYCVDFFRRQLGRLGEFYVPSDQDDIYLPNGLIGGSILHLPGSDIFDAFATNTAYRAISIKDKLGNYSFHAIRSFTLVGGDTYISFADALPVLPRASLEVISWLPILRFGSDSITLAYSTDGVAEVTFNYVSVGYPDPVTA